MTKKNGNPPGLDDLVQQSFSKTNTPKNRKPASGRRVAADNPSMQDLINAASQNAKQNTRHKPAAAQKAAKPDNSMSADIVWQKEKAPIAAGKAASQSEPESLDDVIRYSPPQRSNNGPGPIPLSRRPAGEQQDDLTSLAYGSHGNHADQARGQSDQTQSSSSGLDGREASNNAIAGDSNAIGRHRRGTVAAGGSAPGSSSQLSRSSVTSANVADDQPSGAGLSTAKTRLLFGVIGVLALVAGLAVLIFDQVINVIDTAQVQLPELSPEEVLEAMDEEISAIFAEEQQYPPLISLVSFPQKATVWQAEYWNLRDAAGRDEIMFSEANDGGYVLIYRSADSAWMKMKGEPVQSIPAK